MDPMEQCEKQIDSLWVDLKKRLPIWIFTLFAILIFGIAGLQYHKSSGIEESLGRMAVDVAVIKTEIKYMNGNKSKKSAF